MPIRKTGVLLVRETFKDGENVSYTFVNSGPRTVPLKASESDKMGIE